MPLILANARKKGEEEVTPSSSNTKGTDENRQSTKVSKKDLPIPVPFHVRQGPYKEKISYDVIPHLK